MKTKLQVTTWHEVQLETTQIFIVMYPHIHEVFSTLNEESARKKIDHGATNMFSFLYTWIFPVLTSCGRIMWPGRMKICSDRRPCRHIGMEWKSREISPNRARAAIITSHARGLHVNCCNVIGYSEAAILRFFFTHCREEERGDREVVMPKTKKAKFGLMWSKKSIWMSFNFGLFHINLKPDRIRFEFRSGPEPERLDLNLDSDLIKLNRYPPLCTILNHHLNC